MQDFLILGKEFILTKEGEVLKEQINLNETVRDLCLSYGSSLKGRKEAMAHSTGFYKKAPLIVSNEDHRYYLLTRSLNSDDCLLINYSELMLYKKINLHKTRLYFRENIYYDLNLDSRILKRQIKILREYLKIYAKREF